MKTIIIDGNNLIHKVPYLKNIFLKDKETAQIALVESVKSRSSRNEKIIFIFDGFGKIEKPNAEFSNNFTADEIIRKRIEKFPNHKLLKIVSSDNEIIGFAKICGCEVSRSEVFWDELKENNPLYEGRNINQNYIYDKKEKPDRFSKKDLEEFKKFFT